MSVALQNLNWLWSEILSPSSSTPIAAQISSFENVSNILGDCFQLNTLVGVKGQKEQTDEYVRISWVLFGEVNSFCGLPV